MNETLRKTFAALAISSALALPFALVMAYDTHRMSVARLAYEECSDLSLPLQLEAFSSKFGPAVHMLAQSEEVTHSFEPNTGYLSFASGSIRAITKPGSDVVIEFYCSD